MTLVTKPSKEEPEEKQEKPGSCNVQSLKLARKEGKKRRLSAGVTVTFGKKINQRGGGHPKPERFTKGPPMKGKTVGLAFALKPATCGTQGKKWTIKKKKIKGRLKKKKKKKQRGLLQPKKRERKKSSRQERERVLEGGEKVKHSARSRNSCLKPGNGH